MPLPKKFSFGDLGFAQNLQRLREERGLKVKELAKLAGMGVSTLYKIERGAMVPTVPNLYKLARALQIPVGKLLPPEPAQPVTHTPLGEGFPLRLRRPGLSARRVTSGDRDRRLYGLMITLKPGGSTTKDPITHNGEELVVVLDGEAQVTIAKEIYHLRRGDVLHYNASLPHRIANAIPKTTIILYVLTPSPLNPTPFKI